MSPPNLRSATSKLRIGDIRLNCHQEKKKTKQQHVSSFIIQCNWTRVRVYRYLVSQQKHRTQKAVNSDKQHTHPRRTSSDYNRRVKKNARKHFLLKRVRLCICTRGYKEQS